MRRTLVVRKSVKEMEFATLHSFLNFLSASIGQEEPLTLEVVKKQKENYNFWKKWEKYHAAFRNN